VESERAAHRNDGHPIDRQRAPARRADAAGAAREAFALVFCSPKQRARETCDLASLGDTLVTESDLVGRNYSAYEGLPPRQIRETVPGWMIFRDGCPGARRRRKWALRRIG
jgi:broad specificity phosphatase PhoE